MPILTAMCMFEGQSGWSPADGRQFLIAGDESAVASIQAVLDGLPSSSRGQVFVEVEDSGGFPPLRAPSRFTVTWLSRATRTGAPGTGERCGHGVALDRAVRAWAGEMSIIEGETLWSDDRHDFCAWVEGRGSLIHELAIDVDNRLRVSSEQHAAR